MHTTFYSIEVFVIDNVKKTNVGYDYYKAHQEPITCFYNQKKIYEKNFFFSSILNHQDRRSRKSNEAKRHNVNSKEIINREKARINQRKIYIYIHDVMSINNNNKKTKKFNSNSAVLTC